ncbi:MAG: pyridoxamine 5'-phosphate oxidase family protein [Acidimicrobiales bacterium]|jgi:nitroimidazol reductase NimA-like FMN-containing flavoprotein (pyridoxamine 5'-phosphate oxidase superfamily)
MSDPLGPGPKTRVRRLPEKANYERDVIYAVIDEAPLCHVAAIVKDSAMVIPTLHAREGDTIYLHGSPSNVVMKAVVASGEACISVTLYDGLRLARSGFESSIAYRSVVVFGAASLVSDDVEKARVLDMFVDAVLPGRASEVRAMSDAERRLTMVVAVRIDEASAKLSSGPTDDSVEDMELPVWSGTVPARIRFDAPIPDTNGAMGTGTIAVPASVRRLLDSP